MKTTCRNYTVYCYWSRVDGCFISVVPVLPGCMADGKTLSELKANTCTIIDEWLIMAKRFGKDKPSFYS